MAPDKIVLVTTVLDQGDILEEFIEWHLHLGIDRIVVQDLGSSDETHRVLARFAKAGRVVWFTTAERDMTKYNQGEILFNIAREKFGADWIILCDADEFLRPVDADLRTILFDAARDEFTAIEVPCFNMTGPTLASGQSAIQNLTLRIDRTITETREEQLAGILRVPYIFFHHPPHMIVRASAFRSYGPGAHSAQISWGKGGDIGRLRFLHYNIRGYDKFDAKIRHAAHWFVHNQHLEPWWGWHWRRWIRLQNAGRLREDYEAQFVSPARAQELIRDGSCAIDETVAAWARRRRPASEQTWRQKILARLFG